ncbi:MAG TPA: hypothetical protein VGW39_00005, partial [Chthoniobacterales bacterium]|nr:hypothetical protein [Chthoniobacterales bacterium]
MKKTSPSQSAFFDPRALISFAFCSAGVLLALLAFSLYPGGRVLAQGQRQDQIESYQVEGDQAEANLVQSNQIEPNNNSVALTPPLQSSCVLSVLPTDGGTSGNARAPSTRFRFAR